MNPLNPQPTSFDLCWRMFGIHVRVNPGFWIFSAIFGWDICMDRNTKQIVVPSLLAWIGCTFVSVLIHELGHVFMGRLCGQKGNIILHSFGGLAIGHYQLTKRWQQMAIALAGPAAGLTLFALVWLLVMPYNLAVIGLPDVQGPHLLNHLDPAQNMVWLWRGVSFLLLETLLWNVMNLVPVIPLDGGQIVRAALHGDRSPSGLRFALGLSFLVAGAIAVYSFMAFRDADLWYPAIPSWATLIPLGLRMDPTFTMIIFAVLSVKSFLMMQAVKRPERSWEDDNPDRRDW